MSGAGLTVKCKNHTARQAEGRKIQWELVGTWMDRWENLKRRHHSWKIPPVVALRWAARGPQKCIKTVMVLVRFQAKSNLWLKADPYHCVFLTFPTKRRKRSALFATQTPALHLLHSSLTSTGWFRRLIAAPLQTKWKTISQLEEEASSLMEMQQQPKWQTSFMQHCAQPLSNINSMQWEVAFWIQVKAENVLLQLIDSARKERRGTSRRKWDTKVANGLLKHGRGLGVNLLKRKSLQLTVLQKKRPIVLDKL